MTEESALAGVCYPHDVLPGLSRLFLDYLAQGSALSSGVRSFYAVPPAHDSIDAALRSGEQPEASEQPHSSRHSDAHAWMTHSAQPVKPNPALADLLEAQNHACHAGPAAIANIDKLRAGARAVVTGQQVGLFGGPLYTLHKAASAVRLAQDAEAATGIPHVPIFWLATEDHDFAEVDHITLPVTLPAHPADAGQTLRTVRLEAHPDRASGAPVGALKLGSSVQAALEQVADLLGEVAELDLLRRCYRPEATFAGAFAQWLAATFREQGLIVFDAAGRSAHALGASVLRHAITEADRLEQLLLDRGRELASLGYHQQVLVKPGASLLFLLAGGAANEPHTRLPLKRISAADGSTNGSTSGSKNGSGHWTAGTASYTTDQLLAILSTEPERLSPNALLRPVFQDAILPTAAYIGGPAEIAYFAQNSVLHRHILGRVTPVLPRLSATLIDEKQAALLEHDGIDLPDLFRMPLEDLIQRVGARNLPPEGKQRLHAAGSAMSSELEALTAWMAGMDAGLGRSADVAASKMRYQMNRLRRLAARWELEKNTGIRRRIAALHAAVYPGGHLQERSIGAVSALARHGALLPAQLVEAAGGPCPGHKLLVSR